jgi:riboflavin kinase / FMN adenylyltransferase
MDVLTGDVSGPLGLGPTAVTIGFFDGVHLGHQAVIGRTVEVASQRGLRSVAVTFDRHPREIITPGQEPKLLTTLERKAALIEALGIETLVVLPFTEEFSHWPPEDFVARILVDDLEASFAAIGANFTFGYKAMGNLAVLTDLGVGFGFDVEGVALVDLDGRRVSSSSVREALAGADLSWPRRALGRRFVLDGVVTTGAGRGRGLGWPTANLDVGPKLLLPGSGIYAGRALLSEEGRAAAISVGTNPTFGNEPLHAEAFLLDFEGELRGQPMALEFWERLRDEARFDSPEDLARQIKDDVERTRDIVRDV